MKAINGRRDEGQRDANGGSSLSYEKPTPSLDNLFDSPAKPSTPIVKRDEASPSTQKPRTPSLIAAAQSSTSTATGTEAFIVRSLSQYRNVRRPQILELLRRFPNDRRRLIEEMKTLDAGGKPSASSPAAVSAASSSPAPAPMLYTTVPKATVHLAKPRKNENSAIYAKRGTNGKKKQASDSESEGKLSEAESEMDWSDEDGPRKKKRKNEEVMDPETVALDAFNNQTADELTGTIGEHSYHRGVIVLDE